MKKHLKKYILLLSAGIIGVIAAWVILFRSDPIEELISSSDNSTIVIREEDSGDMENPLSDLTGDDSGNKGNGNAADSESMKLKLESVEGLYPKEDIGYIFVGDSRFVNMNTVCGISKTENLFMVAKVGEGYNWFNGTALQQIKRITSSGLFNKWKIIICLGINDLGNCEKYVKKYESLRSDYDMILVSVNPIEHYGKLSNEEIKEFNTALKTLSLPYIDTYNLLMTTGYATSDGLHYKEDTTKKIYNGILLGLEELKPGTLEKDPEKVLSDAELGKKNSIQSDIIAQNKYVKKEPEPGSEVDEALLQEFLKSLEEAGEIEMVEEVPPAEENPAPEEAVNEEGGNEEAENAEEPHEEEQPQETEEEPPREEEEHREEEENREE